MFFNMKFLRNILVIIFLCAAVQNAHAGWEIQVSNTLAWLRTVFFVDKDTGWIGGSKGTLLSTTDSGKTWVRKGKFTDDTIREVFFFDRNNGWLLLERSVFSLGSNPPSYLMKTTNGGRNWEKVDFNNVRRQRITRIFFAKNGFGLAVGETGALFGLKDDNLTWKKLSSPSRYLILSGAFVNDLRSVIVGGGGTIFFTDDAGVSWNQATVLGRSRSKLNSVFFVNKRDGWTVGSNGKIYQTFNGGKFWRVQSSKVKSELTDVSFINNAEGWAIGDKGIILHTKTAGNVWSTVESGGEHRLEKIFFIGKKGWIVGFGGTVLSYEPGSRRRVNRPTFRTR